MKTTLSKISECNPDEQVLDDLLEYLGKSSIDDDPLPLIIILDCCGLDTTLWCLQTVSGHDRDLRLYAAWCARLASHLMTDDRLMAAINVAERYARGEATSAELAAVRKETWNVLETAAVCPKAWAVAWYVAGTTIWDTVWDTAAMVAHALAIAAENALYTVDPEASSTLARHAAEDAYDTAIELMEEEFRRVCVCIETGCDPYP